MSLRSKFGVKPGREEQGMVGGALPQQGWSSVWPITSLVRRNYPVGCFYLLSSNFL